MCIMATDRPLATQELAFLSPDQMVTDPAARKAYDCDAYTVDKSQPEAILLPENTDQVRRIVEWCNRHAVPYTPRGAGTGLSGGALAAMGGVVISTKRLNQIIEIDCENRCLLAQAGI